VKKLIKRIVALGAKIHPHSLYRDYQGRIHREQAERVLASFSVSGSHRFNGCVLVDAMWDNPNYWIRYTLLRAALGLAKGHEVGVLGPYCAKSCSRTLEHFGISEKVHITALREDFETYRKEAQRLLDYTKTPDDILRWKLPHDLPADFLYDGILKRQRTACVDLGDPRLLDYVIEALSSISASGKVLESYKFDLVVLSHAVNFQFASLAWLAVEKRIPVIVAYGNYGVAKFAKILKPRDIYDTMDRPTRSDLATLPVRTTEAMATVGMTYLQKRRAGDTGDIGARYAFQKATEEISRDMIVKKFCWDSSLPITVIYAANWFDFPHPCGMTHFRDFLDWIQATLTVAKGNRRVNWLFKAHPCDEWYGGVTLSDLIPSLTGYGHIRLVPKEWNGSALLDAIDEVVTYHGTIGVESAALGKPVLVADRGWYHDAGFVKWPQSRQEYLEALATDWWKDLDLGMIMQRAKVFAGWYFGRPAWQGKFLLDDDSLQAAIYPQVPKLLAENGEVLAKELKTIQEWFYSDSHHYHTYKMVKTEEFAC
jgi:hypothetical protein